MLVSSIIVFLFFYLRLRCFSVFFTETNILWFPPITRLCCKLQKNDSNKAEVQKVTNVVCTVSIPPHPPPVIVQNRY